MYNSKLQRPPIIIGSPSIGIHHGRHMPSNVLFYNGGGSNVGHGAMGTEYPTQTQDINSTLIPERGITIHKVNQSGPYSRQPIGEYWHPTPSVNVGTVGHMNHGESESLIAIKLSHHLQPNITETISRLTSRSSLFDIWVDYVLSDDGGPKESEIFSKGHVVGNTYIPGVPMSYVVKAKDGGDLIIDNEVAYMYPNMHMTSIK